MVKTPLGNLHNQSETSPNQKAAIKKKTKKYIQTKIGDHSTSNQCRHENIGAVGDPITTRDDDDGVIRVAFQNIRGTSLTSGMEVPHEIDAMDEAGIDIMGMAETNRPWSLGNKWKLDFNPKKQNS